MDSGQQQDLRIGLSGAGQAANIMEASVGHVARLDSQALSDSRMWKRLCEDAHSVQFCSATGEIRHTIHMEEEMK